MYRFFMLFLMFAAVGCTIPAQKPIRIGIDPTFAPFLWQDETSAIECFLNEALEEISAYSGLSFLKVRVQSTASLEPLQRGLCDALLCSINPQSFDLETYQFTSPILTLSPCLISSQSAPIRTLERLQGKWAGIYTQQTIAPPLNAIVIRYDTLAKLLLALHQGSISAGLCFDTPPRELQGHPFFPTLEVTPLSSLPPLNLSWAFLKGQKTKEFKSLERALQHFRSKQAHKLQAKWHLLPPS
jgi:ABC-type amino acid transport substrate-binding protein